jgi:uncharacterized protein involved in exopolysaccharide biosynthesis
MSEVVEAPAEAGAELAQLREQLETAEMQRVRLLARVAAKDEEFAKERAAWKHIEARLRNEIKELKRGGR